MNEWDVELSYVIRLRVTTKADDEIDAIKRAKSVVEEKTKKFSRLDLFSHSKPEFNSVVYVNKN